MRTEEDFDHFCQTELRGVLEDIEGRRRRLWARFRTGAAVLAALLISAIALWRAMRTPAPLLAVALAALLAGAVWWALVSSFTKQFKHRVISAIAHYLDPSLAYDPDLCISEQDFKESKLFPHAVDRYTGEDYVAGRIGETAIRFSEVHAEYKTTHTDAKGNTSTSWHTIFKGLFIIADFNKEFRSVTLVLPDVAEKLFGWLGQAFQEWTDVFRGRELVKLEDPEFEREFVVYADDQVEARYILTPALMERLLEFKRETGRQVYFSFVRSNVYVATTTGKDLFEPRLAAPLSDPAVLHEYLRQLQLGVGVVEELDLNTRIWTKT